MCRETLQLGCMNSKDVPARNRTEVAGKLPHLLAPWAAGGIQHEDVDWGLCGEVIQRAFGDYVATMEAHNLVYLYCSSIAAIRDGNGPVADLRRHRDLATKAESMLRRLVHAQRAGGSRADFSVSAAALPGVTSALAMAG